MQEYLESRTCTRDSTLSIISVNSELSTPKLYTLLPDKKGPRYISIFNSILNLCHMNNISSNPKFITIDFEQLAIPAIKLMHY